MNGLINSKIKYWLLVLLLMFFVSGVLYCQSIVEEKQRTIISNLKKDLTALDLSMMQIEKYTKILYENWQLEKALLLKEKEELKRERIELEKEKELNFQMKGQLLTFDLLLTEQDQELTASKQALKNLKISTTKEKIKIGFIVGGVSFTIGLTIPIVIYLYDKFKN